MVGRRRRDLRGGLDRLSVEVKSGGDDMRIQCDDGLSRCLRCMGKVELLEDARLGAQGIGR